MDSPLLMIPVTIHLPFTTSQLSVPGATPAMLARTEVRVLSSSNSVFTMLTLVRWRADRCVETWLVATNHDSLSRQLCVHRFSWVISETGIPRTSSKEVVWSVIYSYSHCSLALVLQVPTWSFSPVPLLLAIASNPPDEGSTANVVGQILRSSVRPRMGAEKEEEVDMVSVASPAYSYEYGVRTRGSLLGLLYLRTRSFPHDDHTFPTPYTALLCFSTLRTVLFVYTLPALRLNRADSRSYDVGVQ